MGTARKQGVKGLKGVKSAKGEKGKSAKQMAGKSHPSEVVNGPDRIVNDTSHRAGTPHGAGRINPVR
jgi:hypothetical protein